MSNLKFKLSVGAILMSSIQIAFSQNLDVIKDLNEQGQFWLDRGNSQRAADAWKKLLLINPKDENAIYGLAISELDKKNIDATMEYRSKIALLNPKSVYLEKLDQDILLRNPNNSKLLESARIATQNQDFSEAIVKFREALGTDTPHGAEGFEYYSAMAHIPAKSKESIDGFIRLQKESPNDLQIDLFLSKRLIVQESTRIEGLKQLFRLTAFPSVKSEAMESIRQALVWFGPPRPNEFPLFEQYLSLTPNDKEIRDQLNAGKNKSSEIAANVGSKSQLTATASAPVVTTDPRLLIVKKEANEALARGDDALAKKLFLEAIGIDRNDPWMRLELAKIYIKNGQIREANGLVNGFLSSNPSNTQALFASAILSASIPDWQITLKTLELIKPSERTSDIGQFYKTSWVQTQLGYADNLNKTDKISDAITILSKTRQVALGDVKLTGLLANSYVDLGFPEEAMKLINDLVGASTNPSTDILLQQASVLLKTNQDVECGNILNKIQSRSMTAEQKSFFEDLKFPYLVREAEALSQYGDSKEALQKLLALKSIRPNEAYVDGSIARVYSKMGNNREAINIYKYVLQKNENQPEFLLGLAQAAAQARDFELVNQTIEKYISLDPSNAQFLSNAGKIYRSIGKNSLALKMYENSVNNSPSTSISSLKITDIKTLGTYPNNYYSNKVVMLAEETSKSPKSSKNKVVAKTSPRATKEDVVLPDTIPSQSVSNSSLSVIKQETESLVSEIKQERSPEILSGFSIRSKNGTSGTSSLIDQEVPIEIRFPINDSKVSLKITQVSLNAGSVDDSYYNNMTFGSGVLTTQPGLNIPPVDGGFSAKGVGLSTSIQQGAITADVGVTPLGFLFSKFTGGLKYQSFINESSSSFVTASLSARPVTDSLLSFAGVTDPRSGLSWGGVMANGARINISNNFESYPSYGASLSASYHQIDGTNVKSNSRSEVSAEIHKDLVKTSNSSIKFGLNASGISYRDNLSGFTYGSGGYFSPQQYFALTLPLSFEKRTDTVSYLLKTSFGWQQFNENTAPYYPNNQDMQNAANNSLSTVSNYYGSSSANTTASSNSGFAYNLLGSIQYQFAPQFFLGGNFLFDNSGNYRQWGAGLNLRYTFERITTLPLAMPASSLYSPYSPLGQ